MAARIPLPSPLDSAPFTRTEGLAAGLSPNRMRGRDLQVPFRGIRHPGAAPLDLRARCLAYQGRMPASAFFCSVTAAVIMRLPLPLPLERSLLLHVAVPAPVRAPESRGIIGHKVQLMGGDLRVWAGLRISSPERTWCELGSVLSVPDLVAVGDYLIHRQSPITTAELLDESIERYPGRRGKPALREAHGLLNDRAESRRESLLRVILIRAALPGLEVNYPIQVPGYRYRADLAIPQRKVLIEYQSDYHADPTQFRKDMTRISRLEAAGWIVMQFNTDDLDNPRELVQRIHQVLATRPHFA